MFIKVVGVGKSSKLLFTQDIHIHIYSTESQVVVCVCMTAVLIYITGHCFVVKLNNFRNVSKSYCEPGVAALNEVFEFVVD